MSFGPRQCISITFASGHTQRKLHPEKVECSSFLCWRRAGQKKQSTQPFWRFKRTLRPCRQSDIYLKLLPLKAEVPQDDAPFFTPLLGKLLNERASECLRLNLNCCTSCLRIAAQEEVTGPGPDISSTSHPPTTNPNPLLSYFLFFKQPVECLQTDRASSLQKPPVANSCSLKLSIFQVKFGVAGPASPINLNGDGAAAVMKNVWRYLHLCTC